MSDIGHHDTPADEQLISTVNKDMEGTQACKCQAEGNVVKSVHIIFFSKSLYPTGSNFKSIEPPLNICIFPKNFTHDVFSPKGTLLQGQTNTFQKKKNLHTNNDHPTIYTADSGFLSTS